jgi:hypothetical protein
VVDLEKPLGLNLISAVDKFFKSYRLKAKLLLPVWVLIEENDYPNG